MANHVLKGSERQPLKGARSLGKADPVERLEVTVLLRHRAADALSDRVKELNRASGPPEHIKRGNLRNNSEPTRAISGRYKNSPVRTASRSYRKAPHRGP